ncbi:MAG TPA: hypothetical protein VFU88_11045 [Ktedonobacterales bacterium]|nr:hypothetical protein [Ktedonobacterales bacterium]
MPASSAPGERPVVFILDCDNTLLDNDALKADLADRLRALLGPQRDAAFWRAYEAVRDETGTVDYPLTIERFRPILRDDALLEGVRAVVMDYPFDQRVYPDALPALAHLRAIGLPTIVSDGDQVYQPLKIRRSGLAEAVEGRVLVYVHKEAHLDEIIELWPADFYVMIDDKARILSATKARLPDRFVTMHVRQGHYGLAPVTATPPPDLTLDHIGDLRGLTPDVLRPHLVVPRTT